MSEDAVLVLYRAAYLVAHADVAFFIPTFLKEWDSFALQVATIDTKTENSTGSTQQTQCSPHSDTPVTVRADSGHATPSNDGLDSTCLSAHQFPQGLPLFSRCDAVVPSLKIMAIVATTVAFEERRRSSRLLLFEIPRLNGRRYGPPFQEISVPACQPAPSTHICLLAYPQRLGKRGVWVFRR